MPLEARDAAYLWDMREAARSALRFVADEDYSWFIASALLQSAMERQLILTGEAARRVLEGCKTAHPEVPWRETVAQHNILANNRGPGEQRHADL